MASSEAVDTVLASIQRILQAASSGHCVTGFEYSNMDGPLYTQVTTEAEVRVGPCIFYSKLPAPTVACRWRAKSL